MILQGDPDHLRKLPRRITQMEGPRVKVKPCTPLPHQPGDSYAHRNLRTNDLGLSPPPGDSPGGGTRHKPSPHPTACPHPASPGNWCNQVHLESASPSILSQVSALWSQKEAPRLRDPVLWLWLWLYSHWSHVIYFNKIFCLLLKKGLYVCRYTMGFNKT